MRFLVRHPEVVPSNADASAKAVGTASALAFTLVE
jgi:hypothetical protein